MAPTPKLPTVQHFTHNHPLTEFNIPGDFICDGCKTYGSGKTYRCGPCNYNLHEYCSTCPVSLPTFIHPQHELSLVVRKEQSTRQNERACEICNESVEGLFYRCKLCEFDVHPLCTQLPQHVSHMLHPAHHLEFSLGGASPCMVCHGPCISWRYRCELCRFDIHMECILAVCNISPSEKTEASDTKSRVLKPPGGGHPSSQVPWQQPHCGYPYAYGTMDQQPNIGYPYAYGTMGQQPHIGYPHAYGTMGQQPNIGYPYAYGPMGQQPNIGYPYAYGPMGQHPHIGYPYAYGPMGQHPHIGYPYAYGPMGQQPYHPHNFNNFSYMNGFNTNPDEAPAAGAGQKTSPGKGWKMFTIASRLTIGVVSNVLFGFSVESLFA